jgi:hypothetical protein
MKYLALIILCLLLVGCQSITHVAASGSNANMRAKEDVVAARADLAKVPADVKGADASLADAETQFPIIASAIATLSDTATKYQNLWVGSWFGGKAHALAWWLLVGLIVFAVVLIVLFFSTGFGPVIGEIASWLFHSLTGGAVKIFAWIDDEITVRLAAGRAKVVASVAPPMVTMTAVPIQSVPKI